MQMGSKIAARRNALSITQVELADAMHVTRQTVSRWENSTVLPDIEKVTELADLLGVSCDWLMRDDALPEAEALSTNEESEKKKPSRLLMNLVGKRVQFQFYDDEEDYDLFNKDCTVLSFDGTWFKVGCSGKNENSEKLVSAASVLSVKILGEAAS